MRVIAKRTLKLFWDIHADAQSALESWHAEVFKANWQTPQEIKHSFGSASILKASRAVFNIGGNKYRLVASFDFERQVCYVKFIGSHVQYDAINAETI
jgi:mRNA interferase HigB